MSTENFHFKKTLDHISRTNNTLDTIERHPISNKILMGYIEEKNNEEDDYDNCTSDSDEISTDSLESESSSTSIIFDISEKSK